MALCGIAVDQLAWREWAMRLCCVFVLFLATAISGELPALAQSTGQTQAERDAISKQLRSTQQTLEETRQREQQTRSSLELAEADRAKLNAQLIDMARRVQSGETRLSEIEERLAELDVQRELISGSLARQHKSIGELLAALQRMGRNPPPVMMTKRGDALEMVRSAMMLSSVFPELKERAVALNNRLVDLDRVASEIKTQGEQLREQNKQLAAAEDRLDDLLHTKKTHIRQTQQELAEIQRVAQAQAKNINDLGKLIEKLDETIAQNSELGSYEQELREGRAPGQNVADAAPAAPPETLPAQPGTGTGTPSLPTPKPLSPDRQRVEPTEQLDGTDIAEKPRQPADPPRKTVQLNPGRLKPSIPFSKAKGRLVRPTSGRRIFGFGGKTRFGSRAKGVAYETRARAQITSPNDGWVVYAGPFRSYGQLLILNAGGGYHVLLAGMERINVTIGQFVLSGEPVGKMPAKAKASGSKSQVSAPILYIELRHKGRPIDPDPWWAARSG